MFTNVSLNNMIDASSGLTLLHLSLSGLMSRKGYGYSRSSDSSGSSGSSDSSGSCASRCVSTKNTSCSMTNFNLGVTSAGVTGALPLYRGLRR